MFGTLSGVQMNFVLVITSGPYGDSRLKLALDLSVSILKAGHHLKIFLYSDGVYNALKTISPASDEFNPQSIFSELASRSKIYFCESAGLRRGVDKSCTSKDFTCSGLGELSDMIKNADRVISL